MPIAWLRDFLRLEAASGIILVLAAVAALIFANSPLAWLYEGFLEIPGMVRVGTLEIAKPLFLWVNDLWMAVFFFLVGLEIKREFTEGELSSPAELTLPVVAALGGMLLPALIYVGINLGEIPNLRGWAIPAATDIAFALGVLALLGSRAPLALKVMLTAIAIIDDLGAIVIIAAFYTADLSFISLGLAATAIVALSVLNRLKVAHLAAYVIVGALLWVCVLKSGVHATLAGVITAFAIPIDVRDDAGRPLLRHLEHVLHPWVAYLVLPMFAFANAGVSFQGLGFGSLFEPVTLGIALGLFVGKQLGVFAPMWLAIRARLAPMPENTTWTQLYGMAVLCGIGFTMSLFIGGLAFDQPGFGAQVRLGVLAGSVLSAVLGYALLRLAAPAAAPARGGA